VVGFTSPDPLFLGKELPSDSHWLGNRTSSRASQECVCGRNKYLLVPWMNIRFSDPPLIPVTVLTRTTYCHHDDWPVLSQRVSVVCSIEGFMKYRVLVGEFYFFERILNLSLMSPTAAMVALTTLYHSH
jgi:hypothetical protein